MYFFDEKIMIIRKQITDYAYFSKTQLSRTARTSDQWRHNFYPLYLIMASDQDSASFLVLLHLSAAFNTIDHHILLERLETVNGLRRQVFAWFTYFLWERYHYYFHCTLSVQNIKNIWSFHDIHWPGESRWKMWSLNDVTCSIHFNQCRWRGDRLTKDF